MIEYPVIVVYQALSLDVVVKKDKNVLAVIRGRWSEEKVFVPKIISILQYRYLVFTLPKKVGKALKIAGKLRKIAFKRN